ncbi:DUF1643 domain-containing protein [Antarcticirhabdus aurantiaca]|uniref:DUF1643 domain-containing protein n=1 Tax=Antarcticirhabdus aurantiaca TaxID=2606717 RepID=UPI00131ACA6F|nr:DUF1643 domain-containing protein [Antarcticirhabdus aurantiaca]
MSDLLITRDAVIDGAYRYCLTRDLGMPGRSAAIVMVNPSTADAEEDDHTIRKLYGFAIRNGIGRFTVVNKFAFRSKDVVALRRAKDPVGLLNDTWIGRAVAENDIVIVAWGALVKLPQPLRSRWRAVAAIVEASGKPMLCLEACGDGHPFHPLMRAYDTPLVPWMPPT